MSPEIEDRAGARVRQAEEGGNQEKDLNSVLLSDAKERETMCLCHFSAERTSFWKRLTSIRAEGLKHQLPSR